MPLVTFGRWPCRLARLPTDIASHRLSRASVDWLWLDCSDCQSQAQAMAPRIPPVWYGQTHNLVCPHWFNKWWEGFRQTATLTPFESIMPAGAPHSLVYVYQSDGPVVLRIDGIISIKSDCPICHQAHALCTFHIFCDRTFDELFTELPNISTAATDHGPSHTSWVLTMRPVSRGNWFCCYNNRNEISKRETC